MKRYRTILVTAVLGLLLLPACERENLLGTIRDSVSFAVTVEEGVATKAAPDVLPCTTVDDAGTESDLFLTMEEAPFPASLSAAPATKPTVVNRKDFENNPSLGLVAYAYSASGAAPGDGWVVKTSKLSPPQPEVILPGMIPLYQDTPGSEGSLRPDGSSKWIPLHQDRLLWPGEGYVRYFAVAPYKFVKSTLMGDTGIVEVVAQDGSAPKVNYTVPAPVADQVDLLVSTPSSTKEYSGDPGWRKIDVPMSMVHAMTGIRFRLPEGLTIDELKIENVYGKGTLDLTSSPLAWSQTGSADASYSLANLSTAGGRGLTTDEDKPGYNVTDAANIFYLLPQVLPSGAKITVTLSMKEGGTTVAGSDRTITADISGQEWKLGTLVTYTITHDGTVYVLEVLKDNSTYDAVTGAMVTEQFDPIDALKFSYSGGLRPFSVTSYKISREGSDMKYEGVDWKLQMKKNGAWVDVQSLSDIKDGNNNAWVYDMPLGGVHSHLSGQTGANAATSRIADTVTIAALPSEIAPNAHTTTLRGFSPVGTKDAPVDLSLKSMPVGAETALKTRTDIARSTANCYVVDRPGWYKIPMVYGNAIKDGADNPAAYMPTTITNSAKVDHTGTQITQPWVSMSHDIKYVRLLWQDIPGLLTNISATGTGAGEERYIVFYVDPATIHQGNAVVAAYATEEGAAEQAVAWSWHIWVTDADFSPVQVEGPDYTVDAQTQVPVYGLMRQDIGESAGIESRNIDNPRDGEFRLVQVEGGAMVGKTKELKLIQEGVTTEDLVNDVYHDVSYACYALTYQWGRKDPLFLPKGSTARFVLWPNEYYGNVGGPTYPTPLAYLWDGRIADIYNPGNMYLRATTSYADVIKDPQMVVESSDDMAPFLDFNHWDNNPSLITGGNQVVGNVGNSSEGYFNGYSRPNLPVKTVYDPSPLGWCVPPPGMVQGHTSSSIPWKLTFNSGRHDYNQSSADNSTYRTYTRWSNGNGDFIEFNSYYGAASPDNLDPLRRWCCSIEKHGINYNFIYFHRVDASSITTGLEWAVHYGSGIDSEKINTPYHQKAIRPCQETMSWTAPNGATNSNEGGYTQTSIDGWF